MIIVMRPQANEADIEQVLDLVRECEGVQYDTIHGTDCTVIGLIGDTQIVDRERLMLQPNVDRILKVQEPFKKANRKFHPDDTVVDVSGVKIGAGNFAVIAGPCSVETPEQILEVAQAIQKSGAKLLRGGAFKPRTSPYAFQGLGLDGIALLRGASESAGLPIVSEIISPKQVEIFEKQVDLIQVGARNMQNFDLLKELGQTQKPILLKRGLSSTIEEWLMSAEYIMSRGNSNIILCERGIRTFETVTRNTLDLSAISAVKELSHLPIIVDPSHATGHWQFVERMALAGVAAGADGIMVEVHNNPEKALCDGLQSITPARFDLLMQKIERLLSTMADFEGMRART